MTQFHFAHFAQKTDVSGQVADYSKSNSSSVRNFHTMVSKGVVFKISLVLQCKELELFFGTNYLQQCLNSPDNAIHIVREAKSHLIEEDWNRTISIALTHSSLVHVTQARNCE